MQRITPFLWFDDKAEEAVNFYISIFKNSKIGTITRYGEGGAWTKGGGNVRDIPARRTKIHSLERWSTIHFLSSHIVLRELRDAGRSG